MKTPTKTNESTHRSAYAPAVPIADALASDDAKLIDELISRAPAQRLSRFRLNFDVVEVMQEDRLLRSITVQHA